jgi:hypothetical protein
MKMIFIINSLGAFNSALALLKLYKGASEQEFIEHGVDEDAKRCVVLAIKVPTIINFDEVLNLDAIKRLKAVSTIYFVKFYFLSRKARTSLSS